MRVASSAITAVILLFTCAAAIAAEPPLRFSAQNGEEFHCTVTTDVDMRGVGFSMKDKLVTVYDFKCVSDAAPFEIATSIFREQFSLDMDIPFVGKIKGSIDPAGDRPQAPENPMDFGKMVPYGLFVMHAARVGKPFTLVVDERGTILRVRGAQAMLDKAIESIDADGLINPMMGQSLKQELSMQAFMDGIEGVFVNLPEGSAVEGTAWSREYDRTIRDKSVLKLSEKTTLGALSGNVAAFSQVTTLVKEGQEIKPEAPPMTTIHSAKADKFRIDVEGAIDLATGRPLFSVSIMEFTATLSVQNPMEAKPREVKQILKAETTIEHAPGKAGK